MSRLGLILVAALAGLGAPVCAQQAAAPAKDAAKALCSFHGEGCEAPPVEWAWQRLEPKIGAFSVELPCDERQADAFGQVLAISKASFPAGSTRACMKATSGFTATLIGFTAMPDDSEGPEIERLLRGAPDLFTSFAQQTRDNSIAETVFKGHRAAINTIEKEGRRTKVAVIEVGRFGIIMLLADINSDFPGTPEEADTAVERFFESLEIAE